MAQVLAPMMRVLVLVLMLAPLSDMVLETEMGMQSDMAMELVWGILSAWVSGTVLETLSGTVLGLASEVALDPVRDALLVGLLGRALDTQALA